MYAQGASLWQVAAVDAASYFGGAIGGQIGGAVAPTLGKGLGQIVGGAIGGAVSAALTTEIVGGNLGENVLFGALNGAASAAVVAAFQGQNPLSVADRQEQQGGQKDVGPYLEEKEGSPGHYRLSTAGVDKYDTQFWCRFRFDVTEMDFSFGSTYLGSGYTLGNEVTLNLTDWQNLPDNQDFTIAHEMTHSVQYRELGTSSFLWRDSQEWTFNSQDNNYGIPSSFLGTPIDMSNIVSTSYTLDQICQEMGYNISPESHGWWTIK